MESQLPSCHVLRRTICNTADDELSILHRTLKDVSDVVFRSLKWRPSRKKIAALKSTATIKSSQHHLNEPTRWPPTTIKREVVSVGSGSQPESRYSCVGHAVAAAWKGFGASRRLAGQRPAFDDDKLWSDDVWRPGRGRNWPTTYRPTQVWDGD